MDLHLLELKYNIDNNNSCYDQLFNAQFSRNIYPNDNTHQGELDIFCIQPTSISIKTHKVDRVERYKKIMVSKAIEALIEKIDRYQSIILSLESL